MIRLTVTRPYSAYNSYRQQRVVWAAGQVVECGDEEAAWLQRDAPGCFAPVDKLAEKALDAPPVDKMVHTAPERKDRGGGDVMTTENTPIARSYGRGGRR